MSPREEVYRLVRAVRAEHLPTSSEIIQETVNELGFSGLDPGVIRQNFDPYLRRVFDHALEVLERHEYQVYAKRVLGELVQLREPGLRASLPASEPEDLAKILETLYEDLWHVMHSRSQSRKGRGGSDYEGAVAQMLRLSDIPFERQKKPYRVDFYLPSFAFFNANRTRAILLSAKRTLRERWRQVVEELYHTRAPNVYLPTTEEEKAITREKLADIGRYNVHLLVWDEVKQAFPEDQNVIGWTEFVQVEIPNLARHWPAG